MTVQTEMSWRGKAGVAGVFGVGGASLPIENIKDFFPLEISRISSHKKSEVDNSSRLTHDRGGGLGEGYIPTPFQIPTHPTP